jgi:hypothetical protein
MLDRDQPLKGATRQALGPLKPPLLKLQLETCLARAMQDFEAASWDLLRKAQVQDSDYDLEDLLGTVQEFPPNALANKLVEFNPDLNWQNLQKLAPLEPVKAILRVLTSDGRLFLEPTTSQAQPV